MNLEHLIERLKYIDDHLDLKAISDEKDDVVEMRTAKNEMLRSLPNEKKYESLNFYALTQEYINMRIEKEVEDFKRHYKGAYLV